MPEIARRAGSSVGGFYARFPDKDALLRALEERFFGEMLGRVAKLADAGRWGDAPIAVIARACADELVSVFRERRNLIAAFLHRAERAIRSCWPTRSASAPRPPSASPALLLPRRHELRHPEPRLAIDLGVQFAFALMLQLVVVGDVRAGGRALGDGELVAEIDAQLPLLHRRAPQSWRDPREVRAEKPRPRSRHRRLRLGAAPRSTPSSTGSTR